MNQSNPDICSAADGSFGPAIGPDCRGGFDFTWTFEQYFFSIVPSIFLLLFAPLRLRILSLRPQQLHGGLWLKGMKLWTIAVFAAVQLVLIILWALQPRIGGQGASVASSSLSFVASLVFCALSYLEHSRSLRPSVLLNAYLLLTFVFDATMLRTLWLTEAHIAIRNIFTASFAIKGVILLLEAKEKRQYFSDSDKQRSPEESSGLYNLALFWWLNDMIKQGFRNILRPDDLYAVSDDMRADLLHAKFWRTWNITSHHGQHKLFWVCAEAFRWQLLVPILPRILLIAFTFCQPLLVNRFLNYLQNPDENWNTGYGLIGAYGLVYFGMAVTNGFYNYYWFRCLTMMRSFLVTAIFSKTTELSVTALDNSAAVTLMSADVETIVRNLRDINELWASPIQIIIATYLLSRALGAASVAPIFIAIVATCLTVYLSKFTMSLQKTWMTKIQRRIGVTSTMLGHMKSIKLSGLTGKLTEIISNLRLAELDAARRFYLLGTTTATLASVPTLITPLVTFAVYVPIGISNGTTLDSSRLFTALSLITLLSQPLFSVFQDILGLKSSFGCFDRIQSFLAAESRIDRRILKPVNSMSIPLTRRNSTDREYLEPGPGIDIDEARSETISSSTILAISNGVFGWSIDREALLREIDIDILEGELSIIVGKIGCGKSTLLKAVLGETPLSGGTVQLATTSIAWCEQTPWLINATLQKNIVGYSTFDLDLYRDVIYACDLEADIATFANGDQSLIGSKGITLSGGQKQRVAIARALYANKKFVILDDIFSGLDSTTQMKVFNRLFSREGLLRRRKSTVLLATHAIDLVRFADRIITIGDDGRVSEHGSFDKLNTSSGYVNSFGLRSVQEDGAPGSSIPKPQTLLAKSTPISEKRADASGKDRQSGDVAVYAYYFKHIGWKSTAIFFLLQVIWAVFSTFPNVWLEWWASSNESSPNQRNGYYLGVYAALSIIGVIATATLTWYSLTVMAVRVGFRLHDVLLRTVMVAPLSFFNKTDIGNITTRFSQDMNLLDRSLALAVMCTVNNLLICVARAFLISSATWYIAIGFPAIIAVFYYVQKYYLRTSRQLRFMDLEEKAPVYSQFVESLGGLTTIRAFNWQHDALQQNFDLVDRSQKPFYLLFMIQRWLTLVLDLVTTSLALMVVSVAVGLRNSVSVGFTGVALTQLISFTGYVKMLMLFWTQLETSIAAVSRIKSFHDDVQSENLPGETVEPPSQWPGQGHIEIRNVSASYEEAQSMVLENVSLTVNPGQKIGICGRTGSGKSSLVLVLLRMLELSSGSITIDGLDITTIPKEIVRSRLNGLAQDPFFLAGTIRLNLDPFNYISDSEIIAALDKVGLWSIVEAKGGLGIDFGDDTLSHGQRQLFCLARALLRQGNIVILDEATSSVDHKTDKEMQIIIREHFKDRTVIAIAHRLQTIIDFDRIIVLENGKVVEAGAPDVLLKMKSKFKELYDGSNMSSADVSKT